MVGLMPNPSPNHLLGRTTNANSNSLGDSPPIPAPGAWGAALVLVVGEASGRRASSERRGRGARFSLLGGLLQYPPACGGGEREKSR